MPFTPINQPQASSFASSNRRQSSLIISREAIEAGLYELEREYEREMTTFTPINGHQSSSAPSGEPEQADIYELEREERRALRVVCPQYLPLLESEWLDPEWRQHDEKERQLDEARDDEDDDKQVEDAEDGETAKDAEKGENAEDVADNQCKWADCSETKETAEELYKHLCNDHVGRVKKGDEIQLTCAWQGCGKQNTSRQGITSHIRMHVRHEAYRCDYCFEPFIRYQDKWGHIKRHHPEQFKTRHGSCDICGHEYDSADEKSWHKRLVHGEQTTPKRSRANSQSSPLQGSSGEKRKRMS